MPSEDAAHDVFVGGAAKSMCVTAPPTQVAGARIWHQLRGDRSMTLSGG
jgi:hypothetical protein